MSRGYQYAHRKLDQEVRADDHDLRYTGTIYVKCFIDDEPHPAYNETGLIEIWDLEIDRFWRDGQRAEMSPAELAHVQHHARRMLPRNLDAYAWGPALD